MNAHLLIDAVVQQTMVFIAQLATSGGVRAPLAHVAEQVFADLSRELTNRGVKKNVMADMFGMALRTYHRRVRELGESKTESGRSMKTPEVLRSIALAALLHGCSSPAPSTSSSSHWVTCKTIDDCGSVPSAAACTSGYCVDSSGARLAQASTSGPCNPLTPHELPVTLGTVLGIGRDSTGTTYLADEVTSPMFTDRVFVSQGKSLFRKRVTGSGSSGNTDYSFSFDGDSGPVSLLIHRENGKATAMALGPEGKGFIGDPGLQTTPLTVLDDSAVSDFTLRNLPGDVTIEYVADTEDGDVMVVTHPTDDYDYTDFRMFYGRPPHLDERKVKAVNRSLDGDTSMVFLVGATEYDASFTFVLMEGDGGLISHPGDGSLDEGSGKTVAFTQRWPTPTTLDGFSFTCL